MYYFQKVIRGEERLENDLKARKLTDSALITGVMVIFAFAGNFLLPFLDVIYPLPAILLSKKQNWKYSAFSVFAAGIIIFVLLGFQTGIYYTVSYGPAAIAMSYFIGKDRKAAYCIFSGAAAYLLSILILIFTAQLITGINTSDYISQVFNESFRLQEEIFSGFGNGDIMENSGFSYGELAESILRLIPAVMIMSSFMVSVINYKAAYKIGKRLKIYISPMGRFMYFKLPSNISAGILVFLAGSLLLRNADFVNAEVLQTNISMLFQMIFFIQGAAVISFYFNKYSVKKIYRIIISVFIFFNWFLILLVSVVGMADSLADIRKIRTKEN